MSKMLLIPVQNIMILKHLRRQKYVVSANLFSGSKMLEYAKKRVDEKVSHKKKINKKYIKTKGG